MVRRSCDWCLHGTGLTIKRVKEQTGTSYSIYKHLHFVARLESLQMKLYSIYYLTQANNALLSQPTCSIQIVFLFCFLFSARVDLYLSLLSGSDGLVIMCLFRMLFSNQRERKTRKGRGEGPCFSEVSELIFCFILFYIFLSSWKIITMNIHLFIEHGLGGKYDSIK